MSEKFETFAQYDPSHTRDCETALVLVQRAFGTLAPSLRLIGGLVPRYLTPAKPPDVPDHAATTDVDIVLPVALLGPAENYNPLAAQLKAAGFRRHKNHFGRLSSWRWELDIHGRTVLVEFLQHTDDSELSGRTESVVDEGVSALRILHAGMVQDGYLEREVLVELPNGAKVRELIRYADAVSFIVLKAVALDSRHPNKDAADLIHVMRHAGSVDELAAAYVQRHHEGKYARALEHGLQALRRRFCDEDGIDGAEKEGPVKFCEFHQIGDRGSETRMLEQRNVSGLVTAFVQAVEPRAGRIAGV